MKLRIKFSNTQKFTIQVEEETLGNLKRNIIAYLSNTYGENFETLSLSFNGKDPIDGDENTSLSTIGIVSGDFLTVIQAHTLGSHQKETKSTKTSISDWEDKPPVKEVRQTDTASMSSSNEKVSTLLEAKDGVLPQSVFDIFERYSPSSASEVINLLIHINMLEAGFVLGESLSTSKILPFSWKDIAATIKYHHPGFQNFGCNIVMVTMGSVKQVLASFAGQDSEISVKLEIKEYVPSNQILPHRLSKVAQLARLLRNNLLYPLQVAAHLTLGLPAPWHLVGLPEELLVSIISMLSLRSVLHISSTCKRLNSTCKDRKLWYNLFKRDFANEFHESDTISGSDWEAKYKAAFERKKELDKNSETNQAYILNDPIPNQPFPPNYPATPNPYNPYMPHPIGPNPYYPHPDPHPNPFRDPDSPYFGGEIPFPYAPCLPRQPNPFDPFRNRRPRQPNNPLQPQFMPPPLVRPRGPRFDFY